MPPPPLLNQSFVSSWPRAFNVQFDHLLLNRVSIFPTSGMIHVSHSYTPSTPTYTFSCQDDSLPYLPILSFFRLSVPTNLDRSLPKLSCLLLPRYLPTYLLMYIYLPTYIICLPALFGSINLEVITPSCTKSSYPDLESKNTYSWPCSLWTLFPYTMRLTDAKLVCDLGFAVFFVCTA